MISRKAETSSHTDEEWGFSHFTFITWPTAQAMHGMLHCDSYNSFYFHSLLKNTGLWSWCWWNHCAHIIPCVSFHYWKTLHYRIKVAIIPDYVIKSPLLRISFFSHWASLPCASNSESINKCLDRNILPVNHENI